MQRRLEISIRDQKTRKHLHTITVQSNPDDIEKLLYPVREPVVKELTERILKKQRTEKIKFLKKHTDLFDSKGDDISDEEYYDEVIKWNL